ncbi:MAG: restriction endonuclease subunit S [Bacteroidales bacterium]
MSKEMKLIPKLRFPEFEKNGEWETESLGDVADVYQPKTISQTDLSEEGYPVYGANGIIGFYHEYNHETNQIAIACRGSSCGTVNFTKPKSWITGNAMVVNVDQFNKIDKEFMFFQLDHANLDYLVTGSGQPQITGSIKKHEVFIPPLKEEQQKIASCLSSLDELIAAHKDKLDALKDHKKGLLQNLFPQEGETVPKVRFPEFEGDGEWIYKRLGETGKIITGKTPSTKDASLWNGEILFITPTDIDENQKYQLVTNRTIVRNRKLNILPEGSIAYTCIASIGKMSITAKESVTNQQINSIVVNANYHNEFIYYSLLHITPFIKSRPATSTLPIVNKTEFSAFRIAVPKPQEQQKIASCLSALDELITSQQEKIDQLQQHKKGMMQGLFPKTITN